MKVIAIGDNVVDLYPADKQMYLGGHAANTAVLPPNSACRQPISGRSGMMRVAILRGACWSNAA